MAPRYAQVASSEPEKELPERRRSGPCRTNLAEGLRSVQPEVVAEPDPTQKPPLFRASLIDEATIVERGERVKVWFLPWGETWIRAKDHPNAQLDEVSSLTRATQCPAGTVWQRSIEIALAPRTPLLCRITRPLIENFQTLDYMTKDRRMMRRHVEERWYLLVGNYRLTPSQEPSSFTSARQEHEQRKSGQKRS